MARFIASSSSASSAALARFFAAAVFCLGVCAVGCPTAPPSQPPQCRDLSALCPGLQCVEPRRDAEGCPMCECEVQACLIPEDCETRSPPQRCSIAPQICEPAPACTDGDDDTDCPAACFGRCVAFGNAGGGVFCVGDGDCASVSGFCRFDDRFCLIDEARPGVCSGWCASECLEVETIAVDPRSGICFDFKDSCIPPDFIEGC